MNTCSTIKEPYNEKQTRLTLEDYMEVDPSLRNPYDIFFSDSELELLREYAKLFMMLWNIEHDNNH